MVIAYGDGVCLGLHHTSMDAGTAGKRAFADAAARIMTRIGEPRINDNQPKTGVGTL
jgi:hypothetical protein